MKSGVPLAVVWSFNIWCLWGLTVDNPKSQILTLMFSSTSIYVSRCEGGGRRGGGEEGRRGGGEEGRRGGGEEGRRGGYLPNRLLVLRSR